jgi:hypothetical protein
MKHTSETAKQHEHSAPSREHEAASVSVAAPLSPALQLQQQAGNQAMQQLLRAGVIQAKLAIGNPDDPEEREADQVAHTIMRSHSGVPTSTQHSGSHHGAMYEQCEQKQSQPAINGHATAPSAPAHVPRIVSDVLRSPGYPLDASTRAFFEPHFGRDFSQVRIHTDAEAAASAHSIQAHAYTLGSDIAFATGQFQPDSRSGRHLLAHELTHVAQQRFQNTGSAEHLGRRDTVDVLRRAPADPPNSSPLVPDPGDPGYQESAHAPSYRVRVVAHASPRWTAAPDAKQADQLNLELSQRRADEVGHQVERLLATHLPTGSTVSVQTSADMQDDTVNVDVEAHGSRDTLREARGDRADNARLRRRVDVFVSSNQVITGAAGASRKLLHRPTASNFWHVRVGLVAGGSAGAAGYLLVLSLTNDNTGETMDGKAWTAGGGPKASLGAAYSLSDATGFMTKDPIDFEDFEGKWVTYESAGISLFIGYSWSYLTFWGLKTDPKDIDVSGANTGTAGAGAAITSGKFHFDGDPPTFPATSIPIENTGETEVSYTRTEHGEDKYEVLFATGDDKMDTTESALLDSFLASVVAAKK